MFRSPPAPRSYSPTLTASDLDSEITTVRAQIATLSHRRTHLRTHILSHPNFPALVSTLSNPQPTTSIPANPQPTLIFDDEQIASPTNTHVKLLQLARREKIIDEKRMYRSVLGVTSFPLQDTRAGAPDGGRVLVVRFADGGRNSFLFLVRQGAGWKIKAHTLPRWCGLLVGRTIPSGKDGHEENMEDEDEDGTPEEPTSQRRAKIRDLQQFIRDIRNQLLSFHKRKTAISYLTNQLLESASVTITDEEAKDVKIEWGDGKLVKLRIASDGGLERVVCRGFGGREREVERAVVGGERVEEVGERVEEVGERLRACGLV